MEIIKNMSLKGLNTFGVDARADHFGKIESLGDIEQLLEWKQTHDMPTLLLGGGSNLLFKNDYAGLVAQISLAGKEWLDEDDEYDYVAAAAGENWHQFVRWTITQGYAGLENLSLIPGTVGAAPIQNIGAYGVELADLFYSLQAIDMENGNVYEFDRETAQFGYRESYFKSQTLDKLLITSVTFALPKQAEWKIEYAGMRDILHHQPLTAKRISDAIIELRRSKLPDPENKGNAGSFFKNPIISEKQWDQLKSKYPDMTGFVQKDGQIKISAAWLIDQCGFKGYRKGDAGVSEMHALVLVNYAQARGDELWAVAEEIIATVEDNYGIRLEPEPRVIS